MTFLGVQSRRSDPDHVTAQQHQLQSVLLMFGSTGIKANQTVDDQPRQKFTQLSSRPFYSNGDQPERPHLRQNDDDDRSPCLCTKEGHGDRCLIWPISQLANQRWSQQNAFPAGPALASQATHPGRRVPEVLLDAEELSGRFDRR